MKLKTLSTHLVAIVGVIILILLSACAHPLRVVSPEKLKQYPTSQLSDFELKHGRGSDPEVSQELVKRQKEDIDYLIQNATSLEDFDHIRYPFQTETLSSVKERTGGQVSTIYIGILISKRIINFQ